LTHLKNIIEKKFSKEFGVKPASPPQKRRIKMTAGKPKLLTADLRLGPPESDQTRS